MAGNGRNYQNGKIYKVESLSAGLVYYGSTCSSLAKRMYFHKHESNRTCSKKVMEHPDAVIVLVESFPCRSKEELNARERFYISNNPCVNKMGKLGIEANNKEEYMQEYRQIKADDIKAKAKEYNENNKEKKHEYNINYVRKPFTDEQKTQRAEYNRMYRDTKMTPEQKQARRDYAKKYREEHEIKPLTEEQKAQKAEYRKKYDQDNRDKINAYKRAYKARKKAEREQEHQE